jgi:hypothetical protein
MAAYVINCINSFNKSVVMSREEEKRLNTQGLGSHHKQPEFLVDFITGVSYKT